MKRLPYRERDYAFGKTLLSLRTRLGLTQTGLAEYLGISRRAVGDWEAGASYPKVEHLQKFIALAVQDHAFSPGRQEQDIRALWDAAHQKVPLDETWLTALGANHPKLLPLAVSAQEIKPEHRTPAPLPVPLTSFVGRTVELSEIVGLLNDPKCRLLTLLGPGGVGKTRLALQAAVTLSQSFAEGAAFVPLVSVGSPRRLVYAIGDTLELSFDAESGPIAQLFDHLRARHMLLLLDSFEHLLDRADFIDELLQAAPRVTLLITSQARLNLQAEWLFDVHGLAYPPQGLTGSAAINPNALTEYTAVQLFIQRATQVQPNLSLTDANVRAIARIAHHVAGLPLALELAAAGARVLPIVEIEVQIHSNLDLVATTHRDVPERQRSLRAVFDYSWSLLSESPRALLSRLAVFQGGWNISAAAQIAGATLAALTELVDRSFVLAEPRASEMRYSMLDPIREYALEQLGARGEAERIRRAHAEYFFELSKSSAQSQSQTADWKMEQFDLEHENLYAALQWTRDGGDHALGLELAGSLRLYWRRRGMITEGRSWLEDLLAVQEKNPDEAGLRARVRALNGAAWLASYQHDFGRAAQLFQESLALRRSLGEPADETSLLDNAARQARAVGEYPRATALLEDALTMHRALKDRGTLAAGGIGFSLYDMGLILREQGEFERATALFQECVDLHHELGDQEGIAVGMLALGDVARDLGDVAGIRTYSEPSLAQLRALGVQWAIGLALNNLALASLTEGDVSTAYELSSESIARFRSQSAAASLAEALVTYSRVLLAQGERSGAFEALREALRLALAVGPRILVPAILEAFAALADHTAQARHAVQLAAHASALRTKMGTPLRPADAPALEQLLATTRANLGAETFDALWSQAAAQSLDQLLADTSAELDSETTY